MNFRNKKALLLTGLFLAVLAAGYANYAITAAKKRRTAGRTTDSTARKRI